MTFFKNKILFWFNPNRFKQTYVHNNIRTLLFDSIFDLTVCVVWNKRAVQLKL